MLISSNVRGDISLLNVFWIVAMIELCLWSNKCATRWVFRKPPSSGQGPDCRLFFLCSLYFVLRREWQGSHNNNNDLIDEFTPKKTQEYIKGNCFSYKVSTVACNATPTSLVRKCIYIPDSLACGTDVPPSSKKIGRRDKCSLWRHK